MARWNGTSVNRCAALDRILGDVFEYSVGRSFSCPIRSFVLERHRMELAAPVAFHVSKGYIKQSVFPCHL